MSGTLDILNRKDEIISETLLKIGDEQKSIAPKTSNEKSQEIDEILVEGSKETKGFSETNSQKVGFSESERKSYGRIIIETLRNNGIEVDTSIDLIRGTFNNSC